MNKEKLICYVMVGIVSISIGGMVGASSSTMSSQDTDKEKQFTSKEITTDDRLQQIKAELKAIGITFPDEEVDREEFLATLDPITKKKLEEAANKLKGQKLDPQEALEMRKQRITLPQKEDNMEKSVNFNGETRTLAKGILEELWNGTITIDEAIAGLNEFGITLSDQEIHDLQNHFGSDKESTDNEKSIRPPRF